MLALASRVGGTDDAGRVRLKEEPLNAIKLFLGFVGDLILPLSWDHRKLVYPPRLSPRGIHFLRLGNGNKVAEGVRHLIAVPFKVAVFFLIGSENGGDVAGNTRFFCEYYDHCFDSWDKLS